MHSMPDIPVTSAYLLVGRRAGLGLFLAEIINFQIHAFLLSEAKIFQFVIT